MMDKFRYWLAMRKYYWKQYFISGEWELKELSKYVNKTGIAIDIGANIGIYSYHLSRLAKRVYAFEPNPVFINRLQQIKLSNVTYENIALSHENGVAELRLPKNADGHENSGLASLETNAVTAETLFRTIPVKKSRLDEYHFEDVQFIKIDVEGHEEKILHGAVATLNQNFPTLLIEIEERHNPGGLERINAMLSAFGYKGYYFDKGRRRELNRFDPKRDQNVEKDLETAIHHRRSSPYINNFLFIPPSVS